MYITFQKCANYYVISRKEGRWKSLRVLWKTQGFYVYTCIMNDYLSFTQSIFTGEPFSFKEADSRSSTCIWMLFVHSFTSYSIIVTINVWRMLWKLSSVAVICYFNFNTNSLLFQLQRCFRVFSSLVELVETTFQSVTKHGVQISGLLHKDNIIIIILVIFQLVLTNSLFLTILQQT